MYRSIIISILVWYAALCSVSCDNSFVITILPDTYTVTFNKNGGDTEAKPNTKIVKPSTTTVDKLPVEPTRVGYIFSGWNTKADGSGTAFTADTPVTANITVYARWQMLSVSLSGSAIIKGTYKIGEELSVDTSNISGAVAPFMYQWRAGGVNIIGETDAVYTIQGADAGKFISCVITHNTASGSITATGQIVLYTIKFDITGLTNNDSVSFAEQDSIVETYGNTNDTIIIYYTLTGGNTTDQLILTFNDTEQKIITTPGSSNISYTVAAVDATNGVITIATASMHTNRIVLDAPTDVGLSKGGVISFTAGANSTAAGNMSYTYTLYKDDTAINAYTEQPIANSGTTISGLEGEMLAGTGAYTVRLTAHTTNAAYTANSIQSVASNAINVYSVTVTITGAGGMDKVTMNTADHTTDFIEYVFGSDAVTLMAMPDTGRNVVWSGDGTATGTTLTITNIDADAAVTVTFTAEVAQTITASTYNTTPLIGEIIVSTDGTYMANDGGNEGIHIYQWKRSDNIDRTGNVTQLAENKDYTPVGTDFGKYIWLETTPVGSENLTGTAVQGDVLRVGVKLVITVTGAGGGSATINGSNGSTGVIIYGQTTIAVSKNTSTDTVEWSASEGTFGSTSNESTSYTPPAAPSTGTITLTATLSAEPGTINNPFLVATVEDLKHVGKWELGTKYANWWLSAYYKQTADIDMTGQTFTAIGNNIQSFTGSFDGQGYTITNLTINGGQNNYQGLFGYIQGYYDNNIGEVKNVGLVGGSITGYSCVGGVVGTINSGTVENCYTTGNVTGVGGFVGGVVGDNVGNISRVENCYATGNISGYSYVGGVVGDNSGTIRNCYATGNVTGNFNIGGVAGYTGYGTIVNCIALNASIRATSFTNYIGRVVGQKYYNTDTLTNNYAWERMDVDKTLVKGAENVDGADFTASSAKIQTAWVTAGFTFDAANWKWNSSKMPHLFDNDLWDWPEYITDLGMASNPFLVATVEDLQKVGKPEAGTEYANWTLNAHYRQTANIDMSAQVFTPIGSNYNNRFTGSFDGQGYTIKNLTITNGSVRGLFGHTDTDVIVKNVGLVGGSITASSFGGGIVAYNYGTVQNCYNTGSISGSGSGTIGGLVGNNLGLIDSCYATGSVTSSGTSVGGVAGLNQGTIKNCYATGSVNGFDRVGGVVGENDSLNSDSLIDNCYATGSITGNDYIGGIVGYNRKYGSNTVILRNCVALNESVKSTKNTTNIGRVVGENIIGININNYAQENMTITANNSPVSTPSNAAGIHGADASAADYNGANSGTWWRDTALFPDTAWNFAAHALPTLK